MWIVRTAYTDETNKVTNLLKQGFEPFGIVNVKKKNEDKSRMYFRLIQDESVEKEQFEEQERRKNEALAGGLVKVMLEVFDGFPELLIENMKARMDKYLESYFVTPSVTGFKVEPDPDLGVVDRKINDILGDDIDESDLDEPEVNPSEKLTTELAERKEIEGDFIRPEDFGVKTERQDPKGDGFRVVEEAPEIVSGRTEIQDEMIKKIREKHNVNITVAPTAQDGTVTVFVEDVIYTVRPDGAYSEKVNPANRNSVVV